MSGLGSGATVIHAFSYGYDAAGELDLGFGLRRKLHLPIRSGRPQPHLDRQHRRPDADSRLERPIRPVRQSPTTFGRDRRHKRFPQQLRLRQRGRNDASQPVGQRRRYGRGQAGHAQLQHRRPVLDDSRYADLLGNDLVVAGQYGYNGLGQLTSLNYTQNTTTLAYYTWQYDLQNEVTQETSVDGTTNYTYDPTGQLTGALSTNSLLNESYSYDANGTAPTPATRPARTTG